MSRFVIDSSGMDLRLHSHEFISKFIHAFRKNPCLWNSLDPEYRNKKSRIKAYSRLLKFAKTVQPKITVNEIKKKLQSIRASHRKEKRKVTDSLRTAKNPEEVYVPKLWYYKRLEFLNYSPMEDQLENSNAGISSEKSNIDNSSDISIDFDPIEIKLQESDNDDNESVKSVISNPSLDFENSLCESWKFPCTSTSKTSRIENTESLAQNFRNTEPNESLNIVRKLDRNGDEFDIFGKSVAAELRKMNSRQRIIAKKLMNDVIFHGQLQHLTVDAQIQINNFYTES